MNPYEELGVDPAADEEEINVAWRKRAMETHPDRNPNDPDAPKKFQRCKDAYDVLSDPERRRRFDETGETSAPFDLDSYASALIRQVLTEIISNVIGNNLFQFNIVSSAMQKFGAEARRFELESQERAVILARIRRLRPRCKGKILERILDQGVETEEDNIRIAKRNAEIARRAMEILKEYKHDPEEAMRRLMTTTSAATYFDLTRP